MKVLHLSKDDFQSPSGRAALSLHQALLERGLESEMLVEKRGSKAPGVRLLECPMTPLSRMGRMMRRKLKSPSLHGHYLPEQIPACDLIHLHDVDGFLDKNFHRQLDFSPALVKTVRTREEISDPSWGGVRRVCNSEWLKEISIAEKTDSPAELEVVRDGIDLRVFHPLSRERAREVLGIPGETLVLWLGPASQKDLEKFNGLLVEAAEERSLSLLSWHRESTCVAWKFPLLHVGRVDFGQLASVLYCAADLVLLPGLGEDVPREVPEALACGIPVIALEQSPAGRLSKGVPGPREFTASGIKKIFEQVAQAPAGPSGVRAEAEKYWNVAQSAERYEEIYRQILAGKGLSESSE